jgi:prepilin signal peptidase PulO-like enzyme (type II secretory pathway)
MSPKLFGREPAALLAFFAILVKLFSAFVINVDADVQAWVNAVAAAAVGIAVAWIVHDGLSAAIYGFAQAALALAVGLGLGWSADKQAIVLSVVAGAIGMWTRSQVTAPTPAPALAKPGPTGV